MSAKKMAEALGMDAAEIREYEYQPTVWNRRIWAIGENYYTLTRGTRAPTVTGKFGDEWHGEWRAVNPSELHLAPEGHTVWECAAQGE